MQRGLIALALALAGGTAGGASAAPAATRTHSATSFDHIRLEGPFAVSVRTGGGASVRAEADDPRAFDGVSIEVNGRTLVIRRDRTAGEPRLTRGIRIATATPTLAAATVLGSGTLAIDRAKGDRFDLAVSGAGGVTVAAVEAESVTITVTGAGNATLAGRTRQVRATVQGAGTIAAAALSAEDATVASAGAGTIALAATRTAKINATGSGAVTITGRPACTVASEGTVEVVCGGSAR